MTARGSALETISQEPWAAAYTFESLRADTTLALERATRSVDVAHAARERDVIAALVRDADDGPPRLAVRTSERWLALLHGGGPSVIQRASGLVPTTDLPHHFRRIAPE